MVINKLNRQIKANVWYWKRRLRLSIQAVFVSFILLATIVTAAIAISSQYFFSLSLAADSTLKSFETTASRTQAYLAEVDERASAAVRLLSQFSRFSPENKVLDETRSLFSETMLRNPLFHAIYLGFDNGDFYSIVNLEADPTTRSRLGAEAEDRWVIVTLTGEDKIRERQIQYVDESFKLRHTKTETTDFNFKLRPWFSDIEQDQVHKTSPYLFQQLQVPGETYSGRLKSVNAVIAIDITLQSISSYLKQQNFEHSTEIYIYQEDGELVASNHDQSQVESLVGVPAIEFSEQQKKLIEATPSIKVSNELDWPPINFSVSGMPNGYTIDVLSYFSKLTGIEIEYVNGLSWNHLAEMFFNKELDVLQPVYFDPSREFLAELTEPFLETPFGVISKRGKQVTHISQLKNKKVAIPDGWILATHLEEHFPDIEIVRVPTVKAMFESVREGTVDAAIDTTPILYHVAKQYFIDDLVVSSPLAFGDVQLPQQLHFMVHKTKPELVSLFNAVLKHLEQHHKTALVNKWLARADESIAHLGLVPYKPLIQLAQWGGTEGLIQTEIGGASSYTYVVPFRGTGKQQEFLAIVSPVDEVMTAGLDKVKNSIVITVLALCFLLPIVWLFADFLFKPVRQLAANSKNIADRRYDQVEHVESNIVELNELANSMDNMSASIQEHEEAQQALLDSFIKVIAQAIDDKSPHTAGHCERVPELAFMLVEKANEAEFGIFERFKMETEDSWREFEVAAWLHDCGKITTPEHIIDKGTKLEAIYNRIHEIRMRFEVLWRDAEIDFLTASIDNDTDREQLLIAKQQRQQQLKDDFAFIANANIGGEFMSDEDVERLKQLAQVPWQRYFDNTLGLSHVELDRYASTEQSLPVTESLLSDKSEHIIERVRNEEYPAEFGIKMEIPEHLYNMGELYNLSIQRGTLTAEDRFKINEHIIATIKMLESLPFPEELKNVPRYASTHHETTIGTGYPRQLKGDELSVPERVMVLADIYEALTAADRPYKKAKPISEAVHILYKMMQRGHVDKDVFELFICSGVYLEYAKQYLPEDQLDEVDVSEYLT